MLYLFGSIPFGVKALTGPSGHSIGRKNTFAQHGVTRGKPVLQDIGSELDTQTFDFFFSEEFCDPAAELIKLEAAFALKTPLALVLGDGTFAGLRYVVEGLDITIKKTDRRGGVVRVEASMTLLENPVANLLGLISGIAKARAPALISVAINNPLVRR